MLSISDISNRILLITAKPTELTEALFMNGVMSANTQVQLDSMSGLFN